MSFNDFILPIIVIIFIFIINLGLTYPYHFKISSIMILFNFLNHHLLNFNHYTFVLILKNLKIMMIIIFLNLLILFIFILTHSLHFINLFLFFLMNQKYHHIFLITNYNKINKYFSSLFFILF